MKFLFVPKIDRNTSDFGLSLGVLGLRLFVGSTFVLHGVGKVANFTNWMGPDSSIPGVLQALAALAEFGGGIALILGLLTPLASLGMIFTMIGAIVFHVGKGDPFIGGYELAGLYLVVTSFLFLTGPGRISLDSLISNKLKL